MEKIHIYFPKRTESAVIDINIAMNLTTEHEFFTINLHAKQVRVAIVSKTYSDAAKSFKTLLTRQAMAHIVMEATLSSIVVKGQSLWYLPIELDDITEIAINFGGVLLSANHPLASEKSVVWDTGIYYFPASNTPQRTKRVQKLVYSSKKWRVFGTDGMIKTSFSNDAEVEGHFLHKRRDISIRKNV